MRLVCTFLFLVVLLLDSCIDPFNVKSISYQDQLVVEGLISTDLKRHRITISKASSIESPLFIPERGALVYIKEGNNVIDLEEVEPGAYFTPPYQGELGNTYQLFITTKNGRKLFSEEVTLKDNPEIEDLYATYSNIPSLEKGGFQIYVNTGSFKAEPRFYRWEFEETWEITTPFESNFVWRGGDTLYFRTTPVSVCYLSDTSGNVILKSTQGLNSDKVTAQLIHAVPGDSRRFQVLYSILVRQYSVSPKTFQFWKQIQKINQTQGGLYDTQPGTIQGNIYSESDKGVVLGYFDASVVRERRLFIAPLKFRSSGFQPIDFGNYCRSLQFEFYPANRISEFFMDPSKSNLEVVGISQGVAYMLPKECCNCTSIEKGKTSKPHFWP